MTCSTVRSGERGERRVGFAVVRDDHRRLVQRDAACTLPGGVVDLERGSVDGAAGASNTAQAGMRSCAGPRRPCCRSRSRRGGHRRASAVWTEQVAVDPGARAVPDGGSRAPAPRPRARRRRPVDGSCRPARPAAPGRHGARRSRRSRGARARTARALPPRRAHPSRGRRARPRSTGTRPRRTGTRPWARRRTPARGSASTRPAAAATRTSLRVRRVLLQPWEPHVVLVPEAVDRVDRASGAHRAERAPQHGALRQ